MVYVCNVEEMPAHVRSLRPRHLVSLLEAEAQPPTPRGFPVEAHLRIEIHDISEPSPGQVLAELHHVEALLDYLEAWSDAPILFHCVAGISRSMAAALVALSLRAPGREKEAGLVLRRAAPHALPNRRVVALADELLGRDGRLVAAREAMGPQRQALAMAPLVRLDPLA